MGNIKTNQIGSRINYERKAIFNKNNQQYQQSEQTVYKSSWMINKKYNDCYMGGGNRYNCKGISNNSYYNNKIYIDPRMIKSVIKNTSRKCDGNGISSLQKIFRNNQYYANYSCTNLYHNRKYGLGSKQQRVKKPIQNLFQQVTIQKTIKSARNKPNTIINQIPIQNQSNKQLINNKYNNHIYNKFNHKYLFNNQFKQQQISLQQQQCKCKYHQYLNKTKIQKQLQQQINQQQGYNVPTQRKKYIKIPNILNQTYHQQQNKINNNSQKYQISQICQSQTLKNVKQNNNFILNSHQENKQKCQQIIKRVRNFNQFLNQVKKNIQKGSDSSITQTNLVSRSSFNENQSINDQSINTTIINHTQSGSSQFTGKINSRKKSITMALKLQNQKIELEKYRKLVQRQLSKNHSIQSIGIQNGNNLEKIITINFQKNQNIVQEEILSNQIIKEEKNILLEKKIYNQKNDDKCQKRSKKKDEVVKGKHIYQLEQQPQQIRNRVKNISKLMNKIDGIHKVQSETYRQICEILNSSSQIQEQK